MHVSINPLYRCNFRCPDCYLTEEQLSSRTLLDLNHLRARLAELPEVTAVEFYGGEITLLTEAYFLEMKAVVREFYTGPIAVTTNYFLTPEWLMADDLDLNVSFDFEYRPHHDKVLTNILTTEKAVNLIILATPQVMAGDVHSQMALLQCLHNVASIEIKPYSSNQANQHGHTNAAFVEYVKQWLVSFEGAPLSNRRLIEASLSGQRNAFSDDHVYITPTGHFGVLEFDTRDREFFLELDSYAAYQRWCRWEKRVLLSPVCQSCEFKGRCLTEHYRREEGRDGECSGFKSLLHWWLEDTSGEVSP